MTRQDHVRRFTLLRASSTSAARRGEIFLQRGSLQRRISTPTFMPVGTLGSVKGLDFADLQGLGVQAMLANAYHLMLRPGEQVVAERGGLHPFIGAAAPAILTDSGGFQVYSLAGSRTVSDAGVVFRSHLNGARIDLTPEKLVAVQEALAPDMGMVLDECPPAQAPREQVQAAVLRTTAWATRCLQARQNDAIGWFGILQGALFADLRQQHADVLCQLPFFGFAIGGVSVGESPEEIDRIVRFSAPLLPADKPRYLMGVGTPQDIVRGVDAGVDMFDCVMPTRNARNGHLFTSTGRINLKNAAWRRSDAPIDAHCPCPCCAHYSRGYLRHLFVARELSFYRLASLHNLTHYMGLMQKIRDALDADRFDAAAMLAELPT